MIFIESSVKANVFSRTVELIRNQVADGKYNPVAVCTTVHEDLMQLDGEASWIDDEIRFEVQNSLAAHGLLNEDVQYVTCNIDWKYVSKKYHSAVHSNKTRYASYSPDTIRHFINRHREEGLDISAMVGDGSTTVDIIEALLNKVESLEVDEYRLD